jgi:hypothetical protein
MAKNKEIRFAPTDDERAALDALVNECGFTTTTAALRYLIKFHGEAEVQRKRLLQQGIYAAAAPIQAGLYPPPSPDTPTPTPLSTPPARPAQPPAATPPKTDSTQAMQSLLRRAS